MICFMHEGEPYGYLKVGDKVILPDNLARMVGETLDVVNGWLDELSTAGVYEKDEGGVIFSKRMIRDENLRNTRAAGGSKGGNPALIKTPKDNLKDNLKVNQEDKQNPTPSSSSSSSSSNKKYKVAEAPVVVPDWMPLETWEQFLEMRRRIKKPPTEYAVQLLIDKLLKFKESGQDIKAVLEKSITSSWQDVFEIAEKQNTFTKQDIVHVTVPAAPNQDAALKQIEQDYKKAVPVPDSIRELAKKMKMGV